MAKKKTPSPVYRKLVQIFSSRIARGITILLVLALSVLGMFMLDKGNGIRQQYLTFLESNVVESFMSVFKIERFNILRGAWILFFFVVGVIALLALGNMFERAIMGDKKGKTSAKILYYFVILAICGALTFIAYMLGAFDKVNQSAGVFLNLVYSVLICLLFIVIVPIIAIAIVYLVRFIVYLIALMFNGVKNFSKDIAIEEKAYNNFHGEVSGDFNADDYPPTSAERVFPALVKIDRVGEQEKTQNDDVSLEDIALQFQSFACNKHNIYYGLPLIRSFLAGLGTSRLIILEGLSGTGKSMLPRMFSEFTNSKAFFAPVQATWRDKTDVLGFYSEFAKTFKTTQFLENLYSASYTDKANLMVLDEMNLSRIEYYFADFLSVMEYPSEDWKIRVHEIQTGQTLPEKLENGCVTVPTNTWFVGTANTDDSTFTITDKVYDRAVVIDFEEKFMPITTDYKSEAINISAEKLSELFEQARVDKNKRLSKQETEKFLNICDFMKEAFDVRFGNRIMVQIESFVPVYVALGGTKEEALDFMFARKILRKVDGMFEDFVKDELLKLSKLITATYGKDVFKETEKLIAKFTKRLV